MAYQRQCVYVIDFWGVLFGGLILSFVAWSTWYIFFNDAARSYIVALIGLPWAAFSIMVIMEIWLGIRYVFLRFELRTCGVSKEAKDRALDEFWERVRDSDLPDHPY